MTSEDLVRSLLADLDAGDTIDNVILKAFEKGQTTGYPKGFQAGYLQACDEAEWRINSLTARLDG